MGSPRGCNVSVAALLVAIGLFSAGATASAQVPFTEEATQRGLQFTTMGLTVYGYGLALNDFDGDGDVDLIATGGAPVGATGVFENTGNGNFVDRSATSAIPGSPYQCGVSVADYDSDGDLDVYISAFLVPNRLLRNDGNFVFTDVTSVAGVGGGGLRTQGTTWGDYDGDGYLDLYVCNRFAANQLFRNNGDGTFADVAPALGVDDTGLSYQASFFDHDHDGDVDLYLANEARQTPLWNRHWRNDDGTFTDVGFTLGSSVEVDSMGLTIGDYDHDGGYDMYISNDTPGNVLLKTTANGYELESASAGVAVNGLCWGTLFLDFDNDSWLDIFVAVSHQENRLLRNTGTLPFVDITTPCAIGSAGYGNVATSATYCCATADVDGDGDLDVLVQTSGEPLALYVNHEGQLRDSLSVRLRNTGNNTHAVGAHVRVLSGATYQELPVLAGVGLKSSNPMAVHFGLGANSGAHDIAVTWPDGEVTFVSQVAANQTVLVDRFVRGSFADCNGNFMDDDFEVAQVVGADADANGVLDTCESPFLRGDVDGDGTKSIVDAVVAIGMVFGRSPVHCADAADCNDDGKLDIVDPVYLLQYLLNHGPPPLAPDSACDVDPTADESGDLGCAVPHC